MASLSTGEMKGMRATGKGCEEEGEKVLMKRRQRLIGGEFAIGFGEKGL